MQNYEIAVLRVRELEESAARRRGAVLQPGGGLRRHIGLGLARLALRLSGDPSSLVRVPGPASNVP